jgi:hypothetical protein
MRLFPSDKKYPVGVDLWGFPTAWIPFGKAGQVVLSDRIKDISYDELFIQESLDTLPGKPVYYFHPGAVTPENFSEHKLVGITTDIYRISQDGLGGEVLVRITCPKMYQAMRKKLVTEASPGYAEPSGYRDYNHFAVVPEGYARGGGKMKIELESFTGLELHPIQLNEIEITPIQNTMETQIGEITAQNTMILSDLAELRAMLVTTVAEEATESGIMMEAKELEEKFYQEGYAAGVAAGEILAQSKAYGYEGSDATEGKAHVVTKAFPDISLEAKSPDFISGLYSGALLSLSRAKSAAAAAAAVSAITSAPAITMESKEKKVSIARIPNGQK